MHLHVISYYFIASFIGRQAEDFSQMVQSEFSFFNISLRYFLLLHRKFDREIDRRFWLEGVIGTFCFNISSRYLLLPRSKCERELGRRIWLDAMDMLCFRTSSCYFLLSHSEFDRETCRRFWFEGEIGMFCFNASSRFSYYCAVSLILKQA